MNAKCLNILSIQIRCGPLSHQVIIYIMLLFFFEQIDDIILILCLF